MNSLLKQLWSIFILLPFALQAGGVMLYEISSADTRLGSAGWTSRAQDPSTLFTNPAGMTRIKRPALELGLQTLNAHIDFSPDFADTTVLGTKGDASRWFPSGSFFYVHPINDDFSVGLGNMAYFGADLNYKGNWVGRYYVKELYLQSFSLIGSAAYKITDKLSIGAGVNVMYGIFRQKSYIRDSLDSASDGRLKLHDVDLSVGAVVGALYEFSSCTRVGLQYLSPVQFNFHDTPHFSKIGPRLQSILAATGLDKTKVKVDVNVPQSVMLGIYHDLNCTWSLMGDVGWQQWSNFNKVSIDLPFPNVPTLTSKNIYQDTWHAALGAEYHLNTDWTFSGGIGYDSSAVSNAKRPLDFPVGEQWRFGNGARWYYSDNLTLDLCYELQWSGDLSINVDQGPLLGHVEGKFNDLYIQFINLNLTWAF